MRTVFEAHPVDQPSSLEVRPLIPHTSPNETAMNTTAVQETVAWAMDQMGPV